MTTPNFDELLDDDMPAEERTRLQRTHELLVQAGPPPELPPSLQKPVRPPSATVHMFPQRRRAALLLIAAAVAIAAFGAGYAVHKPGSSGFKAQFTRSMHGTEAAPAAFASLDVAAQDQAGNWPIQVKEQGLKELPKGGYYELWLTKHGKKAASCGTFAVHGDETTVEMNVPYNLSQYDGWIVVAHALKNRLSNKTLLTT